MIEIAMALLLHKGKILIAQRQIGSYQGGKWEFPGGKIEPGETPAECLAREMMEEMGKPVIIGNLFSETEFTYPEKGDFKFHTFWCACNDDKIEELNAHSDFRWVTISEMDDFEFCPADEPIVDMLKNLA